MPPVRSVAGNSLSFVSWRCRRMFLPCSSSGSSHHSLSLEMASEKLLCCCLQSFQPISTSPTYCFKEQARGWNCWRMCHWMKYFPSYALLVLLVMRWLQPRTGLHHCLLHLAVAQDLVDSSYWRSLMENDDWHYSLQWVLLFSYSLV